MPLNYQKWFGMMSKGRMDILSQHIVLSSVCQTSLNLIWMLLLLLNITNESVFFV